MDRPWLHIAFAPRDGSEVRVKSDEGSTHRARFRAPHWWEMGNGAARIADDILYDGSFGDVWRAVQWQPIDNHGVTVR